MLFGLGILPFGASAGYKHLLTDLVSVHGVVGFGQSDLTLFGEDLFRYRRTRFLGGVDLHPQRRGLHGWYVGPRAQIMSYTFGPFGQGFTDANSVTTSAISGSAVGGYRWVADAGFTCALGGGYGYTKTTVSADAIDEYLASNVVDSGGGLVLEMNFSWAF